MGVIEKLNDMSRARTWPGDIPLEHLYTVGVAGERFFREIRDHGRLVAVRCPRCELTYLPPRLYCERCLAQLDDWVVVPNAGTVYSFTVVSTSADGQPIAPSQVIALIRFPGIHGGIIHRLGELDDRPPRLDMLVEGVFRELSERTGSMLDIVYFRPRPVTPSPRPPRGR